MSRIYNHPNAEMGYAIGHVRSDGKVYNHPDAEIGYAIGHVGADGRIYNHPDAEVGYAIGHVGANGRVYNHPDAEMGYAIGHVGTDGRIYNHPNAEVGYAIGHVEKGCPIRHAGGAALLLLLARATSHVDPETPPRRPTQETPPRVTKAVNPSKGSSTVGLGGAGLGIALIAAFILIDYFIMNPGSIVAWVVPLVMAAVILFFSIRLGRALRHKIVNKGNNPPKPQRNPLLHHTDAASNYFSCPKCHTILRIPKGKGRIQITCSKCMMRFKVDD